MLNFAMSVILLMTISAPSFAGVLDGKALVCKRASTIPIVPSIDSSKDEIVRGRVINHYHFFQGGKTEELFNDSGRVPGGGNMIEGPLHAQKRPAEKKYDIERYSETDATIEWDDGRSKLSRETLILSAPYSDAGSGPCEIFTFDEANAMAEKELQELSKEWEDAVKKEKERLKKKNKI